MTTVGSLRALMILLLVVGLGLATTTATAQNGQTTNIRHGAILPTTCEVGDVFQLVGVSSTTLYVNSSITGTCRWESSGTATNVGYSAVSIPADFPNMGVTFTRSLAGAYSSSFVPATYLAGWSISSTIYVDVVNGSDSTGTGTSGNPYQTVYKALTVAIAASPAPTQITIKTNGANQVFYAGQFSMTAVWAISGQKIYITTDNSSYTAYISTANSGLSWSKTGGYTNVYQVTLSSTENVVDITDLDTHKVPKSYTLQTTIAAVDSTNASWYVTGGVVYVHQYGGGSPGTNVLVDRAYNNQLFVATLANNSEIFFQNLTFVGNGLVNVSNLTGDYSANRFTYYNTVFSHADEYELQTGGGANGYNALSTGGINSQGFNSIAAYSGADCFNHHFGTLPNDTTRRNYWALEFNNTAYNCGLNNTQITQNAFTSHDGANYAVIGSTGFNTNGPVLPVVNGSYSLLIGDLMYDSVATVAGVNASYYFDNVDDPPGLTAKAVIVDSASYGSTYDVDSDGSVPILLENFSGSLAPASTYAEMTFLPWYDNSLRTPTLSGTLPIAVSGAGVISAGGLGTVTGSLKGNGSGVITQAACADLSNAAASCSTDTTNGSNISSGTLAVGRLPSAAARTVLAPIFPTVDCICAHGRDSSIVVASAVQLAYVPTGAPTGTGYTNGDTWTATGGTCPTPPSGTLTTLGSALSTLTITNQPVCSVFPTGITAISGGSGATVAFSSCNNATDSISSAVQFVNGYTIPGGTMVSGTRYRLTAEFGMYGTATPEHYDMSLGYGSSAVAYNASSITPPASMAGKGFANSWALTYGGSSRLYGDFLSLNMPGATSSNYNSTAQPITGISTSSDQLLTAGVFYGSTFGVASGVCNDAGNKCGVTGLSGTVGQTVLLTAFNGTGCTGVTATVYLTGSSVIANGTPIYVTNTGTGCSVVSTAATCASGTASCSGSAALTTVLGGVQGNAMNQTLVTVVKEN